MPLDKITVDSISANAVTNVGIANGTIVSVDLADQSVTSPKLGDQSVISSKLASNLNISLTRVLEEANINSIAVGGNVNIDVVNSTVYFFDANTTANVTFNLRGDTSQTFDSVTTIGETTSVAIAVKHGDIRHEANLSIDDVVQTIYYAGMIVIPSFDENNIINYYVGRSYYDNATIRHKNPPVSKDVIGFENQINWKEPIIIVEGAFDAIATKRNAIPLFGKSIHPKLKSKIIQYTKKLYIALDRDAFLDSITYIEYFMNHGIEVYLVNLPSKDPSETGYNSMIDCIVGAELVSFFKLMVLKLNA